MADDGKDHGDDRDARDAQDEGFDPWADLEAEGTAEPGDDFSLSFEDVSLDAGLDGPADELPPSGDATDDALVDAWLQEPATDAVEAASLSVFVPDDPADVAEGTEQAAAEWQDDPAAIEIGTGRSGVTSASDLDVLGLLDEGPSAAELPSGEPQFGDPADEGGPLDPVAAETVAFTDEPADGEPAEDDIIDFGAAAGAATVAAASATADGGPVTVAAPQGDARRTGKRKRGMAGSLLGILLGGLVAIPVVLGILIGLMWMGWKDTVGIRGWMPPHLAFLLPETREPALMGASGGPDLSTAPSLDDLPADAAAVAAADTMADAVVDAGPSPAAEPAVEEPAADAVPPVVTDEPAPLPPSEPSAPALADQRMHDAEPAAVEVAEVPAAAPPVAVPPAATAAAPALDDLAAIVPPPAPVVMEETAVATDTTVPEVETTVPPASEPAPIDLGSLETAVAEAEAALADVKATTDAADPVRKARLVNWYRHLTKVAQELALIENRAVESGRPLPETPASAVDLGGQLLATPEVAGDLARLARNWLTYSRRDGDGVVLPATFSGARRVGPYWCSRVAIAEAGGSSRELAVISRAEPAAVPGDAVIVIGLVMDGGVLWASDLRSAAAGSPTAGGGDPFGQPGL